MKVTSLYAQHIGKGARMVPFASYEMPLHYTDGAIQEHLCVREKAGLFDISHMGVLHLKGLGLEKVIEECLPIDYQAMKVGEVKYTLLLNDSGGILDDLLIYKGSDYALVVLNASRKAQDYAVFQERLFSKGIVLQLLDDISILAVQGPVAKEVAAAHFPSAANLHFMQFTDLPQYKGWISRTGYTGEDGFEIICGNAFAPELFNKVLSHDSVKVIGLAARDSLRLEAGLCLYGQDIMEETNPIEASLLWSIPKSRRENPTFFGGDALKDYFTGIKQPTRKRVGLVSKEKVILRHGMSIMNDQSQEVGKITSGGYSPCLGYSVAMGYASLEFLDASLFVNVRDKLIEAQLTPLPFVQTRYVKG